MRSDSDLLRLYADAKSEEAFAELVRRHIGTVYTVALRRVGGDTHLAQDITQDVFTDLARKAAPLSRREALVGWLFIATRYAAAKAVRCDRQRQALQQRAQQMIEREGDRDREPRWEGLRPALDDAILLLNERDREAILLYFLGNWTFGDLATRFGLSESGARMRVDRALGKLRIHLARRGITSTSAALTAVLGSQAVAAVPGGLAATVTATALAGAANPASAILLYLMTISKTQLGIALAVVLAGAAAVGVAQHRRIAGLQADRTALMEVSAAERRRVGELAGKVAADEAAIASLRARMASLGSTGASRAGNASPNEATSGVVVLHRRDVIRDHPEYAGLERRETRRSVLRMYGRAIAALDLSPIQAGQLKEMLVERAITEHDALDVASQAGFAADSAGTNQAMNAATKDINQAITALVGADGEEKLEALKGTSFFGNGNGVDDLALDLADAGVAISTDQSQTLAQFLHDLSNSEKNPAADTPGFRAVDPTTWRSPLDQQFFSKASTILSPTQLKILVLSRCSTNQENAIIRSYSKSPSVSVMITN